MKLLATVKPDKNGHELLEQMKTEEKLGREFADAHDALPAV